MKKSVTILGREYDIETTIDLNLSYRKLKEIPKEVNELVNLEVLLLNNNKIKKIENLDNLVNLKELFLYDNKIERIENLDSLVNLEYLSLSNNKIERIEGLDNNIHLILLSLNGNKIENIENIHHLEKLKHLCLVNQYRWEDTEKARKISLINERAKKLEMI